MKSAPSADVRRLRASKIRQAEATATQLVETHSVVEKITALLAENPGTAVKDIAETVIAPHLSEDAGIDSYTVAYHLCFSQDSPMILPQYIKRHLRESGKRRKAQKYREGSSLWTEETRERLLALAGLDECNHDGSDKRYPPFMPHFGKIARALNSECGTDQFTRGKCHQMYHMLIEALLREIDVTHPEFQRKAESIDETEGAVRNKVA
ncbi:MAG: hypothetical protein WCX61_05320 [Candidatus Peribacteraceae bacterium]